MDIPNLREELQTLYKDTMAGIVNVEAESGREAWRGVFRRVKESGCGESRLEAERMFYKACRGEEYYRGVRYWPGAALVFLSSWLSVGSSELPARVMEWYESVLRKRFIRRELGV